jgi:hypothetical protein
LNSSGLAGSASSVSRANTSACSIRNRCESGTGRDVDGSIGEVGSVGDGGYA